MTKSLWLDIKKIQEELHGISLDGDFPEIADPSTVTPAFDPLRMGALPPTPDVNPALMSQVLPSSNVMETGLTATEQALLSDEEKGIRLRQRGMTT